MLDGISQRTATYDSQSENILCNSQGERCNAGLLSFAELEQSARETAYLLQKRFIGDAPIVHRTKIQVGSRRTEKHSSESSPSVLVERFLIVELIVRGKVSLVPVRWHHAADDTFSQLENALNGDLRHEVTAARMGVPLEKTLRCPVILEPYFAAQLIHECIGHTSEADNFLAYARTAGVDLGHQWCDFPIQVIDDPTLPGRRASYERDDDGELARCSRLVIDGRWNDLLLNAEYGCQLNLPSGHGRRVATAQSTLPRMSNTWLAPGNKCKEELIASIGRGILCAGTWGGGSVGLDFVIRPAYGRWIEHGRLTNHYVRRFDLIGSKIRAVAAIADVSNEMRWFSPFFGCDKFGQDNLPVTFGSPHILLTQAILRPIKSPYRGTAP